MNKIYQKEAESGCEYSLPDYMGDVKKILSVNAVAIPSAKFASDEAVEFSGIVSYDILYCDSEGKLTRILTSSDYDIQVPTGEGYLDSLAEVTVASISSRLTGPRKLILKSLLSAEIIFSRESSLECSGSAFADGESPEVLTKEILDSEIVFATSPEREYAEEAEHLSDTRAEDIEVIATSGSVRITETFAEDGGVMVRGELIITSIIRTSEQPPFAIKRIIPFEEKVTVEGLLPDMQISADGYMTSVSTGVAETDNGCSVTVNAISELSVIASKNTERLVTLDAYLKNKETEGEYEDCLCDELVLLGICEQTFDISENRSELLPEGTRDIIGLFVDVRPSDKKLGKNSMKIEGTAVVSGVACEINEENKPIYSPLKFTAPFAINVNFDCQIPENALADAKIKVTSADARVDGEHLSVSCAAQVRYRVHNQTSVRRMRACNVTADLEGESNAACITVYYPDAEESLFSIAKKFHTSVQRIAEDNRLSVETASSEISSLNVKRLLIG